MGLIGQNITRVEGKDKVTGKIRYISDLSFSGMVHAKVLRSASPHARIQVDTSQAVKMPGVLRIVTGADLGFLPKPKYGPAFLDQTPLAIDKVRYVGEPVAAVVARSEREAEEAVQAIVVHYDDLPPILTAEQGMKDKTSLVHDKFQMAGNFADLGNLSSLEGSNVCLHYKLRKGDVSKVFTESDFVFEHTYTVPATQHCSLETQTVVSTVESSGKIKVWSTTQNPSLVRNQLAGMFGVPLSKVQVITGYLGGGFGEKTYYKTEPLTAILAYLTGKTVRFNLSREEAFLTIKAPEMSVKIKSGVMKDGKIKARQCELIWDVGAAADIVPRLAQKSGFTAAGPYYIPNVQLDSHCVYTNKPSSGPLRGFGIPPLVWAYESHTDEIAEALGLDPLEFRRQNLLEEGQEHSTGTLIHSSDFKGCLAAVSEAIGWNQNPKSWEVSPGVIRAKGMGVGLKACLTPSVCHANVVMHGDGSITVYTSTVDMGQGSSTIFSQIAAEELGLPMEKVELVNPDTDITPFDQLTAASRSTFHMGNAIRQAAVSVREQVLDLAAKQLEVSREDLVLTNEKIVHRSTDRSMSLRELLAKSYKGALSGYLIGSATIQTEKGKEDYETGQNANITVFWFAGAAAVEIEVDTQTGQVRIAHCAVSGDVGKAINPGNCHQQLEGAAVLAIGHTFTEEMLYENGRQTNANFSDYKIPGFSDVPPIETYLIENPHNDGPYGAKGVGETATFAVSAAVANALERAIGVRIRNLPITQEKVLEALRETEPSKLAGFLMFPR
jgi:CO/xanthine dehydrogenase Mo-binding subunit